MKQRTYKATGINLKATAMGEADKMVTVLTKEHGIVRAIAPGARKHKSRLAGRSGLFVVNELLFTKGKSIDKMIQAETERSFPKLSRDLAKLTASQYLAELALAQALSGHPQEELCCLLIEHLSRIEAATKANILPCLAQATFHLLALAGVAPDMLRCCLSRSPLTPELGNPDWKVAFSVSSGGTIALSEIHRLEKERLAEIEHIEREWREQHEVPRSHWHSRLVQKVSREVIQNLGIVGYLSGAELALMQQLSKPELIITQLSPQTAPQSGKITERAVYAQITDTPITGAPITDVQITGPHLMWRHIEQFLRQYAQYQFDKPIKSAALIDTCFTPLTHAARA